MNIKLLLALCAAYYFFAAVEAGTLRGGAENTYAAVPKLDYEGVEANVRSARQTYTEDESSEDSDEYDEDDDAALQQQADIRRQQAYEQSLGEEGSNEDSEDNFEEDDDDDNIERRFRRDAVDQVVGNNEIEQKPKPIEVAETTDKKPAVETSSSSTAAVSNSDSSNTSVLILIRDAIKKVTELPNTQLVATSAQQYFQLFEHFLQQTIEQVIGDDDDEDEVESTTIVPEEDKETATEISDNSDNLNVNVSKTSSNKETSVEQELAQPQQTPEEVNEIKA